MIFAKLILSSAFTVSPILYNTPSVTQTLTLSSRPQAELSKKQNNFDPKDTSKVPFYSQFDDISDKSWQKRGCGVASLAMIIDFYNEEKVSVNRLLKEGRTAGAYIKNAGWSHNGLVSLAKKHKLRGKVYDFSNSNEKLAFDRFKNIVDKGPVIASVHYKLEPNNPIPHLVVITKIEEGVVYYNDPADEKGGNKISSKKFKEAWKKQFISIRKDPSELEISKNYKDKFKRSFVISNSSI